MAIIQQFNEQFLRYSDFNTVQDFMFQAENGRIANLTNFQYELLKQIHREKYLKMKQVITECSTHEARKMEDSTINIYLKSSYFPADEDTKELFFPEELCYRNVEEDDVFAIFESIEENNRIMLNEFVSE